MSSFNEIPERQNQSQKGIIIGLIVSNLIFAILAIFLFVK